MFRTSDHLGMYAKLHQGSAGDHSSKCWEDFLISVRSDMMYFASKHKYLKHVGTTDLELWVYTGAGIFRDDCFRGKYLGVRKRFLRNAISDGKRAWTGQGLNNNTEEGEMPPEVYSLMDYHKATTGDDVRDDPLLPKWMYDLHDIMRLSHPIWAEWALYLPRDPEKPGKVDIAQPEQATGKGTKQSFADLTLNNGRKQQGNFAQSPMRLFKSKEGPSLRHETWRENCDAWSRITFEHGTPRMGIESLIASLVKEPPLSAADLVEAVAEHAYSCGEDTSGDYPDAAQCYRILSEQLVDKSRIKVLKLALDSFQHLLEHDDPSITEASEAVLRNNLLNWLHALPQYSVQMPVTESLPEILDHRMQLGEMGADLKDNPKPSGRIRQKDHDGRPINVTKAWRQQSADHQQWLREEMRDQLNQLNDDPDAPLSILLDWLILGNAEGPADNGGTRIVEFTDLHKVRELMYEMNYAGTPRDIPPDKFETLQQRLSQWYSWAFKTNRHERQPEIDDNLLFEVPEQLQHCDPQILCWAAEEVEDWREDGKRIPENWGMICPDQTITLVKQQRKKKKNREKRITYETKNVASFIQLALQHACFTLWMDELQAIAERLYGNTPKEKRKPKEEP